VYPLTRVEVIDLSGEMAFLKKVRTAEVKRQAPARLRASSTV
jgi:hypothetical protein